MHRGFIGRVIGIDPGKSTLSNRVETTSGRSPLAAEDAI
jgi:hypothetical protein